MKISKFNLAINNIYNYKTIYPAVEIVDDYNNSIIFCRQLIIDNIQAEIDQARLSSSKYDYCSNMNCSLSEYIETLTNLIKFVNKLNAYGVLKVSEYLPKNKRGHIKDSVLPIYMTGIYINNGSYSGKTSSVELSLCPYILRPLTDGIFPVVKVKNKYIINFTTTRMYNINDTAPLNMCLINQDCY